MVRSVDFCNQKRSCDLDVDLYFRNLWKWHFYEIASLYIVTVIIKIFCKWIGAEVCLTLFNNKGLIFLPWCINTSIWLLYSQSEYKIYSAAKLNAWKLMALSDYSAIRKPELELNFLFSLLLLKKYEFYSCFAFSIGCSWLLKAASAILCAAII